jgi:hypothetical protein
MRISRHDLRRRYSNSLVIDAGSQFSLRACSQAKLSLEFLPYQVLSGIVPDKLKIAKVMIPLFKSGERKIISIIDLFQYILPGFSKVLEKAVYYRKINYLDIYK